MTELERLLAGREERASLQAHVLRGSEVIVQVSLNIPGLPKRMAGDREVVSLVMGSMRREMQPLGGGPVLLFSLDNGAGYACILGANGVDPVAVKRLAMAVEDLPWGSVIDVDVLTRTGALHRAGLTGGERKCFLCGRPPRIAPGPSGMNTPSFVKLVGECWPRPSRNYEKRGVFQRC